MRTTNLHTAPMRHLIKFRTFLKKRRFLQPRTQALSSMRRRGGKTLVGAGHVIDQILIV